MKVWISYSQRDKLFVERLRSDLERQGIQAVIGNDVVSPGDSWVERISESLKKIDTFLIVLSKESAESKWMTYEIAYAVSAKKSGDTKHVIPIIVDRNVQLPPFLYDIRYLDFSDEEKYHENLSALLKSITTLPSQGLQKESEELKLHYLKAQRDLIEAEKMELNAKRADISRRIGFLTILTAAVGAVGTGLVSLYSYVGFSHIVITVISFIAGILVSLLSQYHWSSRKLRKGAEK